MELSEVLTAAEEVAHWLTAMSVAGLLIFAYCQLQYSLFKRTFGQSWQMLSVLRTLLGAGYFALGLLLEPRMLIWFWLVTAATSLILFWANSRASKRSAERGKAFLQARVAQ